MTLPSSSPLDRLVAVCRPTVPLCPRCGRGVSGLPIPVAGAVLMVCTNRVLYPSSTKPRPCDQPVAVISGPPGMLLVLALRHPEWTALCRGQPITLDEGSISPAHDAL